MSSPLKQNTTTIQELLNTINSLPEAGGVELPELSNPASAEEVFLNKEFIDEDGNSVTGTFSIDDELTTQDSLISQIVSTLQNKASATPTLQTKTVTPTTAIQNVTPDSGYDGLSKVTVNAMPTATQATPTVSIDSAGKITASATQTAGYVSAGTKTGTKQLTTQAAKTVTPSASDQTAVASGIYTTGAITVKGDSNLKAANIAEGVSIFGVTGTHSGGAGGSGSSMDTCNLLIDCINMNQIHMVAITIENRVETIYTKLNNIDSNNEYPPYTINNVKCGSIIVINVIGCEYSNDFVDIDSGGILIASCKSSSNDNDGHWTNMYIFKAPTTANVDCNILIDA